MSENDTTTPEDSAAHAVGVSQLVRQWSQSGFAVVSRLKNYPGVPYFHAFLTARWAAEDEMRTILHDLPEELRLDLAVIPATLTFDWPNTATMAGDEIALPSVSGSASRISE